MNSEQINDGGSAFPTTERKEERYTDNGGYGQTRVVTLVTGGMTLRDYFAAKALQGILSVDGDWDRDIDITNYAYTLADYMLKSREPE